MIKYLFSILFVSVLAVMFFCFPAMSGEFRMIDQDNYGLVMEFTLPEFNLLKTDNDCHQLKLSGWAETEEKNVPRLPKTSILFQVPETGDIAVEILENDTDFLSGIDICPTSKDSNGLDIDGVYPGKFTQIDTRCVFRDTILVRLHIYPFQYDKNLRRLSYSKKMRICVKFENPLSDEIAADTDNEEDDVFEKIKRKVLPNYRKSGRRSKWVKDKKLLDDYLTGVKMIITEDGMYRVTYEDLTDLGVNPDMIDAATYRVYRGGEEVSCRVNAETSHLSPGESIEFYGEKIDTLFTRRNLYWLFWGGYTGKRMTLAYNDGSDPARIIDSFYESVHIEENATMWLFMPEEWTDADYRFWERLIAPRVFSVDLDVYSPAENPEPIWLRVCFQGRSIDGPHPNHHSVIKWNGAGVSDAYWDGSETYIHEVFFTPETLDEGAHSVGIELPGDTGAPEDIVYLDWVELKYQRRIEASNNRLVFEVSGDEKFRMSITNFSREDIRIFDITSAQYPMEYIDFAVESNDNKYAAVFGTDISGKARFLALTNDLLPAPDEMTLWESAGLKAPENGADYIVITARDLENAVAPLRRHRENQKLRAKVVSLEDIVDAFNFGIYDPVAIKDFLEYTFDYWEKPAPSYVLLVGDATLDYKDYDPKKNVIPTHLTPTPGVALTPDDSWYVCFKGKDLLPEMSIGRIPGSTVETVGGIVDKIIRYESVQNDIGEQVLMIADNNELVYEELNNDLAAMLPETYTVENVFLRNYGLIDNATLDIVTSINKGALITNYVGHGVYTSWAGEEVFTTGDINLLTNTDKLTFVISVSCLGGYFAMPTYGLAESFILPPDTGAVAAFFSSGSDYYWEAEILNTRIFTEIYTNHSPILGDIVTQSKLEAYARGITEATMKMFHLFGDPASKLALVYPFGDIDRSGTADLSDGVLALKLLNGIAVDGTIDIRQSLASEITLADIVYILQTVADIR